MAKRKKIVKKPKVRLSSSKVILLCAVIMSACILMLAFSVLFGSRKPVSPVETVAAAIPVEKLPEIKKPEDVPIQPESVKSEQKIAPEPEIQKKKPVVPSSELSQPSRVVERNLLPASDIVIPEAIGNAALVFVFDDGGQNLSQLQKFLDLPFPLTVAVLPCLVHSVESAQKIRASGNELMLHQPMQAINTSVNPGPGAITPQMHSDEVFSVILKNIAEIGPVAGFNNHEGSLILENRVLTEAVIEAAIDSNVYFLDSRTTANTCAPQVALELGVGIYSRDIFLDNVQTRENVLSELQKGLVVANKKGYCIMIGHVWSANLLPDILKELYPLLLDKGYRFSLVSQCGAL